MTINRPWSGENRFLEKVFRVKAFKDAYLAKMGEMNESIFQPARINPQVDQLAGIIRDSIKEESEERLTDLNNAVEGNRVTSSMGPGMNVPVNSIKPFVVARTKSVKDQLEGKSDGQRISQFGR
jgi:hypothetical protein